MSVASPEPTSPASGLPGKGGVVGLPSATAPTYLGAVGKAVYAATSSAGLRNSLLLGAYMEGGWNPPFPMGDNGTSFGPFQMHIGGALTSAGYTRAQAEDPTLAVKAMIPAYRGAGGDLLGITKNGAARVAFLAERPAQMYPQSRIDAGWAAMHGQQTGTTGKAGSEAPGFTNPFGGLTNPLDAVKNLVGDLEKAGAFLSKPATWIRIGEFVVGAALIIAGLSSLARPLAEPAAKAGIKIAKVLK